MRREVDGWGRQGSLRGGDVRYWIGVILRGEEGDYVGEILCEKRWWLLRIGA